MKVPQMHLVETEVEEEVTGTKQDVTLEINALTLQHQIAIRAMTVWFQCPQNSKRKARGYKFAVKRRMKRRVKRRARTMQPSTRSYTTMRTNLQRTNQVWIHRTKRQG